MSQGVYHSSKMMWVVICSWNYNLISHRPSKSFHSFQNLRANGQSRLFCAHTLLTGGTIRIAIGRQEWRMLDVKRSSRGWRMGTAMRMRTGCGMAIGPIVMMGFWWGGGGSSAGGSEEVGTGYKWYEFFLCSFISSHRRCSPTSCMSDESEDGMSLPV